MTSPYHRDNSRYTLPCRQLCPLAYDLHNIRQIVASRSVTRPTMVFLIVSPGSFLLVCVWGVSGANSSFQDLRTFHVVDHAFHCRRHYLVCVRTHNSSVTASGLGMVRDWYFPVFSRRNRPAASGAPKSIHPQFESICFSSDHFCSNFLCRFVANPRRFRLERI